MQKDDEKKDVVNVTGTENVSSIQETGDNESKPEVCVNYHVCVLMFRHQYSYTHTYTHIYIYILPNATVFRYVVIQRLSPLPQFFGNVVKKKIYIYIHIIIIIIIMVIFKCYFSGEHIALSM